MQQVATAAATNDSRKFSAVASVMLLGLSALYFALWLPQYLTWPWWSDHDVFATMALGWSKGLLPYRELLGNNFPGTIYFFWIVGKLTGWGNVVAYNAFDAMLLTVLGLATLVWSRRRFGSWLPGAAALYALSTYYFNLDFAMVAQRDWHATLFVALAMIVLELIPSTSGLLLSAMLAAIGFSVRPQILMFVPGLLCGAWDSQQSDPETGGFRRCTIWLLAFGGSVALLFFPILRDGLVGDLLQGLASVMPGTAYNAPKGSQFFGIIWRLGTQGRVWAMLPALAILWTLVGWRARQSAFHWSLLLAGSVAYLAITPNLRPYVYHAFWMIWLFVLGVLVAMVSEEATSRSWSWQACAVALLGLAMFLDVGNFPNTCRKPLVMPALRALAAHQPAVEPPVGYTHPYGKLITLPPWSDYQATLAYLRSELPPSTCVGNAIGGLAVNGPSGRLPAFPAESMTWLFVVRPADEDRFITTLRATPDSVVVWNPDETGKGSLVAVFPRMDETIRTLYEPAVRFGTIAIWRRKGEMFPARTDPDRHGM